MEFHALIVQLEHVAAELRFAGVTQAELLAHLQKGDPT